MIELLEGVLLAVVLLAIGFVAGRMTIRPVEGRKFEPGKIPLTEHDPYREALENPNEVIKDRE